MEEKYYYSQERKGFYCDSIHGKNKPSDCIEISLEKYQELLNKDINSEIILVNNQFSLRKKVFSKEELKLHAKNLLSQKCDQLREALVYNDSYAYNEEEFLLKKQEIFKELKQNRTKINLLKTLNKEELKQLLESLNG